MTDKHLTSQKTHAPKAQDENHSLTEPRSGLPKLVWRKEVSAWARFLIFGLYGLICFSAGKRLMDQSAPIAEIKRKTAELSQKLDALHESREIRQRHALGDNNLSPHEIKQVAATLKLELTSLYSARESANLDLIRDLKTRNQELERHLQNLLSLQENNSGVSAAEAVPYNSKNLSILGYEQQLKKKRLEEQLSREREAFLALHDMEVWNNQKSFKELKDHHALKLYELDQEFRQERQNFRDVGHRRPASH